MEVPVVAEEPPITEETENAELADSVENFEKFVYELFDKNGVLNDLRAYLRGHIVNVLKSAQTGDPPPCQRHFTQRLDLTYQALNMLVAEYLLRLEFSYSLSVFVSEIPLANMVFEFAKTLMRNNDENFTSLRFQDSDVWSILNYLGVMCDSEHSSNIVEMYKSVETCPLLLCIFKCIPMYNKPHAVNSSDESISSSVKSSDTLGDKTKSSHRNLPVHDKCKHYALCWTCQSKMIRVKEKYCKKKKSLTKSVKETKLDQYNVDCLMKNIGVLERSLIDEMFQQLKSVYEAEVEMVKEEEQRKVKRSLATHALQLQKRRHDIEESLKAREVELELAVQQKKKFLWGLARALRDQHRHVSHETERLTAKEDSLKIQLGEAEEILKQRGEEVRSQITSELAILEQHLESMKTERENINRERTELNNLKKHEKSTKEHNTEHEQLKSHYDLLKNELSILRKYLESMSIQPKCVIERSTITDLYDVTSKLNVTLNNGQDVEYARHDGKLRSNQVVNDFKKQKNVNFSQSNLDEIYREASQERRSSSSDVGDMGRMERFHEQETLRQLRDENQRLKTFAAQQSEHITELRCQQAQMRAQLTAAQFQQSTTATTHQGPTTYAGPTVPPTCRPRTAPAVVPPATYLVHRMSTSASAHALNHGWRKGAGEELSLFSNAQPRILVPGDTIPFIGVLKDRHNDNRRHIVNQWRNLRRRTSPIGAVVKPRNITTAQRDKLSKERPEPSTSQMDPITQSQNFLTETQEFENDSLEPTSGNRCQRPKTAVADKMREKSPNTVLREVKNKLRTKDSTKRQTPTVTRDKSPNSVLREAKLRLRKLEIEAEAVEKSYLNFRKRQAELRNERTSFSGPTDESVIRDIRNLEIKRSSSLQKVGDTHNTHKDFKISYLEADQKTMNNDIDKYLKEYQTKYDIGETYFKNKNVAQNKASPIPESYSEIEDKRLPDDYLETPIIEFRKLYYSEKSRYYDRNKGDNKPDGNRPNDCIDKIDSEKSLDANRGKVDCEPENQNDDNKLDKAITELEILKHNINKIYDLPDEPEVKIEEEETGLRDELSKTEAAEDKNLLRVEVESVSEVNDIKVTESQTQDLLLVVQSPIEVGDTLESDSDEKLSPQMTIIVSPKRSSPKGPNDMDSLGSRSLSPVQARLTRNDVIDAIFRADPENQLSSVQMQLELSKDILEDSITESEKGEIGEYPDDFSADVDNYNSRSDYENNSPISIPKTSEDENFWDS
ncbi:uncharacterized protein LOC115454552 isoform X2 [Manduca sexta]|uniref:uncharacterized protein LOC115454552 isoform X2 n=1 Tax=Manduca sexta TaxID=7130 RepID=UPI00188EB4BB|nr:uncharacterized protein LOC115454552 isoform X2 [Manduca sexta]